MRFLRTFPSLAAGFLLAVAPAMASAQDGRAAAGVWNDAYGKTDNQRSLDLTAAELQRRARDGGFGPATSNTNVEGDLNSYTTNTGQQNSSTSYNSNNSNSTTTNANGSDITISVSTGQTSGTTNQTATSKSTIGSITSSSSCGGVNSCTK